jgi:hypothetical protein
VSVTSFGAKGDGVTDSTAAFSAAFASGAGTIYLPFGVYVINGNIKVPATVHHIVGMNSIITPAPVTRSANFSKTAGIFQTQNTKLPLLIEKIVFNSTTGLQLAVEDMGTTPLMLRDIVGMGVSFQRDSAAGDLYVEDVSGGFLMTLNGAAPVWGAQVDSEGGLYRGGSTAGVRIANNGAPLYILGAKSEGDNILVANTNGAITDILGAFQSPDGTGTVAMYTNTNSKLQVTGVEYSYLTTNNYSTVLVDTEGAVQKTTLATSMPARPGTTGFFIPQILGGN